MKTPRFWQSRNLTSAVLMPAAWLYRLGAWADRTCTTPTRAPLPVIAIGNVTAGGAGKTPTTLALIPILRALGHTPHILTRGYKGAALTAHRVTADDRWQQVGDEALLLAAAAPTWVGRDRLASARAAAAAGATILLCDDALQHHALAKTITLLVIDGPYGIGNGLPLPAGPLRESLRSAATRSAAAIVIGADAQGISEQLPIPVFHARFEATDTPPLRDHPWIAFAGIGRPEKFYSTLRALGAELIATHDFPDHHAYRDQEVTALLADATARGARLITTTKDAVKLAPAAHAQVATLPVALTIDDANGLRDFLTRTLGATPSS